MFQGPPCGCYPETDIVCSKHSKIYESQSKEIDRQKKIEEMIETHIEVMVLFQDKPYTKDFFRDIIKSIIREINQL